MLNRLYTFGYLGKTPDDLKVLVEKNEIVIILDVRQSPCSRTRGGVWNKGYLGSFKFGAAYIHCRELGNKTRSRTHISLVNPTVGLGVLRYMLKVGNVVLLCAERDHTECHREYLADEMFENAWCSDVIHL